MKIIIETFRFNKIMIICVSLEFICVYSLDAISSELIILVIRFVTNFSSSLFLSCLESISTEGSILLNSFADLKYSNISLYTSTIGRFIFVICIYLKISDKFTENPGLIEFPTVQVCDATDDDSSNAA